MDSGEFTSPENLATLGNNEEALTCSMHIAKTCGRYKRITPFSSFEAASAAVKGGSADAFLVPGAYPSINAFIMDRELQVVDVFPMKIPPLVLATAADFQPGNGIPIFHHPATSALLKETDITLQDPRTSLIQ